KAGPMTRAQAPHMHDDLGAHVRDGGWHAQVDAGWRAGADRATDAASSGSDVQEDAAVTSAEARTGGAGQRRRVAATARLSIRKACLSRRHRRRVAGGR